MKLLDCYKAMLEAGGMVVNADGSVSLRTGETTSKPMKIGGKRLIIPTTDQLNNPDWSERIAFHPLSENVVKGETAVLTRYRRVILTRMNDSIYQLMKWMIDAAASPKTHASLTPAQAGFLAVLPDIKEEDANKLTTLLENAFQANPEDFFISINVVKGGTLDGKKNVRTANVFFDFYTELTNETVEQKSGKPSKKLFGVLLSNKLHKQLVALVEYLIPDIKTPSVYSAGVTHLGGTFCEALMLSVEKVGKLYDNWFDVYGDKFDGVNHKFVTEWVDVIHDVSLIQKDLTKIPDLSGTETGVTNAVTAPVQQYQTPAAPQQVQHTGYVASPPTEMVKPYGAPIPTPTYATSSSSEPETFDQAMRRKQAAMQQQQQGGYAPQQVAGYNNSGIPGYGAPAVPATPMVNPEWGRAFASNVNPAYGQVNQAMANRPYGTTFNAPQQQNNGGWPTTLGGQSSFGGQGILSL